jgi:hypothetical protein
MNSLQAWIATGGLLAQLVALTSLAQADRAHAEVRCEATGEHLVFDCTVRLTNRRTGAPLESATITVSAEMPSMPMGHHVRPVQGERASEPGTFRLRIALEMPGVWALRLIVNGPLRDVVVARLDFRSSPGDRPVIADEPHGHDDHQRADRGAAHGSQRQGQKGHGS